MTSPTRRKLVLGIESSCDETAAAVVDEGSRVLSNVVASQNELHAEYRGVVPEIASRAHCERILPVVDESLRLAGVSLDDLAGVAVGNRPGLIGSLLVGVAAAKGLAWSRGLPMVGVDHVEAHLFAALMQGDGSAEQHREPAWPAIGLVVSGGHSSIYRLHSPTSLQRLGGTIDDAIGEAYDKCAAILGLGFPGGPAVDRLAQNGRASALKLPVARLESGSLDFSFSGLKTAVLYAVEGVPGARRDGSARPHERPRDADVCAAFQQAAVMAVMLRLARALDLHPECRTLLAGGGVTANSHLRAELARLGRERGIDVRVPAMDLCVDNAAMIAGLGRRMLESRAWRGDDLSISATPTTRV